MSFTGQRHGFSLIEMLAVVALIATLVSVLAVGISRQPGAGIRTAEIQVSAALQAARTHAVMQRTESLFAVLLNSADEEANARRYAILVREPGGEDSWRALGASGLLPENVYFSTGALYAQPFDFGSLWNFPYPLPQTCAGVEGDGAWWGIVYASDGRLRDLEPGYLEMRLASGRDESGPVFRNEAGITRIHLFPLGGTTVEQP